MFSKLQIDKLFFRLLQTKEELLYDLQTEQVERYSLSRNGGTILGVAHCDFVESAWSYPRFLDDQRTVIRSGQVDDRVGVWLLLDVLPDMPEMPQFDVLLTTDEEIGQSSAGEVDDELNYNWTFQFDRRGIDFVDYDLASRKFLAAFAEATGIPYGIGSFSDICSLPETCGSRVNVGCGYRGEHSPDAIVDLLDCWRQVERFSVFARQYADTAFPMRQRRQPRVVRSSYRQSSYDYSWSLPDDKPLDDFSDFDNWK